MRLCEIQSWIQKGILSDVAFTNEVGEECLKETSHFSHQQRWGVYRFAISERLFDSLREDFDTVCKILGEQEFRILIRDYLKKYPSKNASLLYLGQSLYQFVMETDYGRKHEWLPDMVKMEFALLRARYTRTEPEFEKNKLALLEMIDPQQLKLKLWPGTMVIQSEYPLIEMYKKETLLERSRSQVVIFPLNYASYYQPCEKLEYGALDILTHGGSLQDLLNFFEQANAQPDEVSSLLHEWMQNNWLCDIEVSDTSVSEVSLNSDTNTSGL